MLVVAVAAVGLVSVLLLGTLAFLFAAFHAPNDWYDKNRGPTRPFGDDTIGGSKPSQKQGKAPNGGHECGCGHRWGEVDE